LIWDVTVVCPLEESYVEAAALNAGTVAEIAAVLKSTKYVGLGSRYIFLSTATESLSLINNSATMYLSITGNELH